MWRSGGLTYDGEEQSLYLQVQDVVCYYIIYQNRLLEYTKSVCCINFYVVFFIVHMSVCASPTNMPSSCNFT